MSGRRQFFQGNVNDVAGRDVVKNNIHIHESKPESELQTAFWQNTGIYCSKVVREHLEALMDYHDFTVPELRRAWSTQSLVWDQRNQSMRCASGRFEVFVGWAGLTLVGITVAIAYFQILAGSSHGPFVQPMLIVAAGASAFTLGSFIMKTTVFAHYTAKRAVTKFQLDDR